MRRIPLAGPLFFLAAIGVIDPSACYGAPLTESPVWVAEGDAMGGNFGVSVATAGDVNGDGFSDLIVGAWKGGTAEEGRAYVYLGSAAGVSSAPGWTFDGGDSGAHLGFSVAPAGDVNGDGYSDVVVGAPGFHDGLTNEGCALLFLGSRNGLGSAPAWSVFGRQLDARLGSCVAGAGDVDGDGFDDLLVGADRYDAGERDEGRALLFLGRATGPAEDASWTSDGGLAGAAHGASVAGAGDVNGDGYDDILIGAPGSTATPHFGGKSNLYFGGPNGPSPNASWTSDGEQVDGAFGASVAGAGDLNGDGYADIAIGAPGTDGVGVDEGVVLAYLGSATGPATTEAWRLSGDVPGARLGACVSTAGDVDGDGFADLIVGAPFERSGDIPIGAAFLFLGSAAGLSASSAWTAFGGIDPSEFGNCVGSAGDVDGDGFGDVVVGAWKKPGTRGEEGGAFAYSGSAGPAAFAPSWIKHADFVGGFLGYSMGSAGDVNGDGYSDLLISCPYYGAAEVLLGRVWMYLGSSSGLGSEAAWDKVGTVAYGYFGHSTAGAGDVNGDGYDDVIVGAYFLDGGGHGRAYLYFGSASGLSTEPGWIATGGREQNDHFAYCVAGAGDVNGDGYADLLVGSMGANDPDLDEGKAYLYLGSPSGPSSQPSWSTDGGQAGAELGWSVASAGDVNGDGFADAIIGAHRTDHAPGGDDGAAYVFHGGPGGLAQDPAWTVYGEVAGALFGNTVASAGDVNSDGYSDVIVTAPAYGWVYLYFGSDEGLSPDPGWTTEIRPSQMGWVFDTNVAAAGDVNGDGFGDIVVGDPWQVGGGGRGQSYVFLGSPSGPGEEPFWAAHTTGSGIFGHVVANAGDVNGDGFSDVAVGDPWADQFPPGDGKGYVFLGNGGDGLPRTPSAWTVGGAAPIALRGLTDNPYSFRLKALGRTAAGRGRVRLESEVKPLGAPFDGSSIRSGTTVQTAAPEDGVGSVVALDELAPPDLTPGTAYRWRVRIAADSPFFPRTPWFSPQGNGPSEIDLRTRGESEADVVVTQGPRSGIDLAPTSPNPFTDRARVVYTLREPGEVRVTVHDVTGRRVAVLAGGHRPAGRHRIDWDGRSGGALLPAGTYVLRVEAAGVTRSEKIARDR
jgi:hypothetical protein